MPCMYACQVGSTVILQMKKPVGQETAEFKMKRADFRQVEKIKVVYICVCLMCMPYMYALYVRFVIKMKRADFRQVEEIKVVCV
jgi:hypothetical protein